MDEDDLLLARLRALFERMVEVTGEAEQAARACDRPGYLDRLSVIADALALADVPRGLRGVIAQVR